MPRSASSSRCGITSLIRQAYKRRAQRQPLLRVGPHVGLTAGDGGVIGSERRRRVRPDAVLANRDQTGTVPGAEPERVVTHRAAWAKEQDGDHLKWNGVVARFEVPVPGRLEAERAIFYRQVSAREPDQAVAIGVWNACGLESEAAGEHHDPVPSPSGLTPA